MSAEKPEFNAEWLGALADFAKSLPDLGQVVSGDGTGMDGSITIIDGADKKIVVVYWNHESEQWLIEIQPGTESA